jgi:Xaa-Pro aminopeptidase
MQTSAKVPLSELDTRMIRFRQQLNFIHPDWEFVAIFSKLNIYYFTGTMQEGMLLIQKNEEAVYWVRRSYDKAVDESLFKLIKPMDSFRDAAKYFSKLPHTVFTETEFLPLAMFQRFQKHFPFKDVKPVDNLIAKLRSVKSNYELSLMTESGRIHKLVLEDQVPHLLKRGITEVDFALELYSVLVKEGHQGLVRFGMFDTEMVLGHIAFGENSLIPTSFNGPGGNDGICPAVPFLGNRNRKLTKGDLVFVDIGCGVNGYHTDKTMTYMFGTKLPSQAIEIHEQCVTIQNKIAGMLKPGSVPSEIYNSVIDNLPDGFLTNFMGYGNRQVKFLGHGIGLTIDEIPVLAQGFDDPIEQGMVFAVEPKKGINGVGMVGIENTFLVTPEGGKCITGTNPGLIFVEG